MTVPVVGDGVVGDDASEDVGSMKGRRRKMTVSMSSIPILSCELVGHTVGLEQLNVDNGARKKSAELWGDRKNIDVPLFPSSNITTYQKLTATFAYQTKDDKRIDQRQDTKGYSPSKR